MKATFFGHSRIPQDIKPLLIKTIVDLIVNNGVNEFYVGNHGAFDCMVRKVLMEIKKEYQNIEYSVVLAYLPTKKDEYYDYSDTIYPDLLEKVPYRFAICRRNDWMINHSDVVITYTSECFGGAYEFKKKAQKRGKIIIELYNPK